MRGAFPVGDATQSPAFGTAVANGILLDQRGNPFLPLGDSAWGAMGNLSITDWTTLCQTRAQQGFNSLMTLGLVDLYSNISGHKFQDQVGNSAFTGTTGTGGRSPDFTTPNATYWNRIAQMVGIAQQYGLTILFIPIDAANVTGATGSPSDGMVACRDNGTTGCTSLGTYLGNLLKGYPNVMWMHGNDYEPDNISGGSDDQYLTAMADAIRAVIPGSVHTVEVTGGVNTTAYSLQGTNWTSPRIKMNQGYPGTSDPAYSILVSAQAAAGASYMTFLGEGFYDDNNNGGSGGGTNNQLRRQAWWAMVTGCPGYYYGNLANTNGANTPYYGFFTNWQNALASTGVTEAGYWARFWQQIAWGKVVQNPDTGNTWLTSGISSGTNKAFGAVAKDGSVGVVYAPAASSPVIDMTKLAGQATITRYDPTTGIYTVLGSFANTGTQTLSSGSAHGDGSSDYAWLVKVGA